MYEKGMHPGATWRKTDFQIHTPRDPGWKGSPNLPGGGEKPESIRKEWAKAFVSQCLEGGLQAIAITDHHDFCFVEYIKQAVGDLGACDKLWIYPGVEVTCDDAVQCLVLFDVDTSEDIWHRIFGKFPNGVRPTPKTEACASQAVACGQDIKAFLQIVFEDLVLNKAAIAIPHASNDGAHKSMLRDGFHERFKSSAFDGVYTEISFAKLGTKPKGKIYGNAKEWGTRRRGIVTTGDNRHADFAKLGANECWVRLGEPTTEAIRQAILADEARITYEHPTLPSQRVIEMEVSSSLTGEDFKIKFNDGFNAVIGGRGSGKSAILEYLRFGLGRAAADIIGDFERLREREHDLVTNTLGEGVVKIKLARDDVEEVWIRNLESRDSIRIDIPDGTTESISIGAAQQRFRARGFYQKQLSTLVSDERSAADQITGIAAAESIDDRQAAERELAAAKRQLRTSFQQATEYWIARVAADRDRASVIDIKRRIDAVRKRLEASGVSPDNQKILDEGPLYSSISDLADEAKVSIETDLAELREIRSSVPSIISDQFRKGEHFAEVKAFTDEIVAANSKVSLAIERAIEAILSLDGAHSIFVKDFGVSKNTFDSKYSEAMEQQAHARNLVEELQVLNASLQSAEAAERRSATNAKVLERAPAVLTSTRRMLDEKRANLRQLLERAATQVQSMSGEILEATVSTESKPEEYQASLMAICEGSRIREATLRIEHLVKKLSEGDQIANWQGVVDVLLELYQKKLMSVSQSVVDVSDTVREKLQSIFGELTVQQAAAIYSRIDSDNLPTLLEATPIDYVVFSYKDPSGLIEFKQASPGQQAAALLHLLLYQQAGTLIIDQPEDDLDNRTIMNIVRLLQVTKQKRQLIFATHNPNFVVNGDADKIIALTPAVAEDDGPDDARIAIDADGAIETSSVRSAITEIMEGGRAAFELRGRKYQFR